jgi:hypothetical protein
MRYTGVTTPETQRPRLPLLVARRHVDLCRLCSALCH